MTQVNLHPGMPIARALKRLKRKLEKEGFFEEMRKRRHFISKSEKKRLAKNKAIRKAKKEQNG